ncbi:hypothetical protein C7414_109166 [Cupriavidus alkaliphilus]|uniref:Uncharacterized protein n=1 Tax=Cupriavidus alkaliphilus TaxID=942866 RepID=A0A7W4V817_9BURK|nr:hypothetical protein [Cupriavidus alkaliphilus]PVY76683.1 hypothetical protein C7414_109166 [Cupriavidus alkaliphilus]SCB27841.1 hypothetical protein GA0116996_10987 [Cupriavidus alkaliphilus]
MPDVQRFARKPVCPAPTGHTRKDALADAHDMPGADPHTRGACSDLSHSVSGSIGPRYESFRMWLEAMSEDASVVAAL